MLYKCNTPKYECNREVIKMNNSKVMDLSVYIKQIKVPKLVKSYTTPDGITYIPSRANVSKKSVRCEVIINGFSIGDKNITDENIVNHLILKDENNTNEVFDFIIDKDAIDKEFRYTPPLLDGTVWHSLIDNKIYAVVDGMLLKITGNASRDNGTLTEDELSNEAELFSKYNAKTVISELVSITVNEIKNNNKVVNQYMSESDVLDRCKLIKIPLSQIHQHEIPTKDILTINPLTISTIKLNEYAKDTIYPLKTNQFIGLKFSGKNPLSETYLGDKITFDIYHRQNVTGEFKPTPYEYKARIIPASSEETEENTLSVYEITDIPVKSLSSKYSYSGEWNEQFISGKNIVFLSRDQSDPPRPFLIYGVSSPSGEFRATYVNLYDLTTRESFTVNRTMVHSPECDLHNFIEWKFWYANIIMLGEE